MRKKQPSQGKASANKVNASSGHEAVRNLDVEIHHLRSLFRDTISNYGMLVEGEIAQLADPILESLEQSHPGMTSEQLEIIQEMTTMIRQLRIRPEKGRRKDLKKMEDLVTQLTTLAEKWQWTT